MRIFCCESGNNSPGRANNLMDATFARVVRIDRGNRFAHLFPDNTFLKRGLGHVIAAIL
jgi:hypothetical protein